MRSITVGYAHPAVVRGVNNPGSVCGPGHLPVFHRRVFFYACPVNGGHAEGCAKVPGVPNCEQVVFHASQAGWTLRSVFPDTVFSAASRASLMTRRVCPGVEQLSNRVNMSPISPRSAQARVFADLAQPFSRVTVGKGDRFPGDGHRP